MWKAGKNLCFNFYAYLARIKNGLKSVQAKRLGSGAIIVLSTNKGTQ
jgi:hypothetical protein